MVESISIKNVASYDTEGIQISDLKKVNFIYGANGCGKTTISNFLADSTNVFYQTCNINWKQAFPLKTLVYNKQFRDNNFGKGNIAGIFTLGQATAEEIAKIEIKQTDLKNIKTEIGKTKDTLDKQKETKQGIEKEFQETSWTKIYKKYENVFKEAFVGFLTKEKFKDKLLQESKENNSAELDYTILLEKSKTLFGEIPQILPLLNHITFTRLYEIEMSTLWTKKIIGKSDVEISKIIQRLNLNDWVNEGRSYLQDDDTCPFCQKQTITDDFRKQLEDYFDETFLASTKQVSDLKDEYDRLLLNLTNELIQIEINEKSNPTSKLEIEKFSAYLKTLTTQHTTNKELLKNKIKEPSRSINLLSTKEQLEKISELITTTNEAIKQHNMIVANYQTEKASLIKSIWKYITNEFQIDIQSYIKTTDGLQKGIDKLIRDQDMRNTNYLTLDREIKELGRNVTSIQPTIDEINRTLKSYGFLNFEIVPSESHPNHYQIKRENGELAESTLSEGEVTFITFLYFLQLAKGAINEEEINADRILVVDDPISSLDSNILFVVSTLLKKIIKDIHAEKGNIKQLILLTHNVYFHKEASFIDGRTKENKNTYYWILRKQNNTSRIQAYGIKNPIQTSYELLWQEFKNREQNSGVTLQNTMRRIIENYFKILGKYGDDELIEKFTTLEEQEICRSLISWINDGSHSINDDLYIEVQDDAIDKYLKVFEAIFEKTDHQGHYKMMMGVV